MAGRHYPGSYAEMMAWFPTDAARLDYLDWLRWSDGFICPSCESTQSWRLPDGRRSCGGCRRMVSATAGTIFHGTRTPLTIWFSAAWFMTSQKDGASALGLQRVLGLGSYGTAWTMLHRYPQGDGSRRAHAAHRQRRGGRDVHRRPRARHAWPRCGRQDVGGDCGGGSRSEGLRALPDAGHPQRLHTRSRSLHPRQRRNQVRSSSPTAGCPTERLWLPATRTRPSASPAPDAKHTRYFQGFTGSPA